MQRCDPVHLGTLPTVKRRGGRNGANCSVPDNNIQVLVQYIAAKNSFNAKTKEEADAIEIQARHGSHGNCFLSNHTTIELEGLQKVSHG